MRRMLILLFQIIQKQSDWVLLPDGKTLQLGQGKHPDRKFEFDSILGSKTSQENLYDNHAKVAIDAFMKGFNSTIFAYGQTASGKTYSMVGPEEVVDQLMKNCSDIPEEVAIVFGIIPRAILTIFTLINEGIDKKSQYTLKCQYLEVYNETIQDILTTPVTQNMKIREFPGQGIVVVGAEEKPITMPEQVFECLALGQKNKVVCATASNLRSSRSHTVFILTIEQKSPDGTVKQSRLNLVDLAGSEKLSKAQATGQQLEETKKINQSLTCLGMCIMALTGKSKQHIPFRDSKLTMLLKESLGGNSKTLMMCTGSIKLENEEETVSTLRFAQRAKKIVTKAKNNVKRSVAELEALVELLKKEVAMLRAQLKAAGVKVAGNKDLDGEMADVEEPDVEDLQPDEDIQIKYTELESKFQALQEKSEIEIEKLKIQAQKSEQNEEKIREVELIKQTLLESQKEVEVEKVKYIEIKTFLEQQILTLEQKQLGSQDEVEILQKEIERLRAELEEVNQSLADFETTVEKIEAQLEQSSISNQQLTVESRKLTQEISEWKFRFDELQESTRATEDLIEDLRQQLKEKAESLQKEQKEKESFQVQVIQLNERKEQSEKQILQLKEKVEEVVTQKEVLMQANNELVVQQQVAIQQVNDEVRKYKEQYEESQSQTNAMKVQIDTLTTQASSAEILKQMEETTELIKKQYQQEKEQLKQENQRLQQDLQVTQTKLTVETQQITQHFQHEITKIQKEYEIKYIELETKTTEYKEKFIIMEQEKIKVETEHKVIIETVEKLQTQVVEKEIQTKTLQKQIVEIHHTQEQKIYQNQIVSEDREKEISSLNEKHNQELQELSEERTRYKKEKDELKSTNEKVKDELASLKKQISLQDSSISKKTDELVKTRSELSQLEKQNQTNLQKLKEAQQQIVDLKNQISRMSKEGVPENINVITKKVTINQGLFGQHILKKTNNAFIQKAIEESKRAQELFEEMNRPKQVQVVELPKEEVKDDIPSPVNMKKTQQLQFDEDSDDNAELN